MSKRSMRFFTAGLVSLGLTMLFAMRRNKGMPFRRRMIRIMGKGIKVGSNMMGAIGDFMMGRLRV